MDTFKKLITPFERINLSQSTLVAFIWLLVFIGFWIFISQGERHLFPSPGQVLDGFKSLMSEGLLVHITCSLGLCFQATLISIAASLVIVYLSPIPLLKPLSVILSKMRYLPLTGITFYIAMLISNARTMQVWVLVIFMSLYFITSMISVIKDIPEEEFNHAKSLKCSRWETLWEVIIKGRLDYVFDVLRQNLAITWMMLVSVESILVAAGGLGVLIKNSDKFMNHGRIVALQLVILFIGLLLDWSINFIRKILFRYSTF